jgi:sugar transferase (PEP-CTERM system associated)
MVRILHQYVSRRALALFLFETVVLLLAYCTAALIRLGTEAVLDEFVLGDILIGALLLVAVFQVCLYYHKHYDAAPASKAEQLIRIAGASGCTCLALGMLCFLLPSLRIGRGVLVVTVLLAALAISGLRLGADQLWFRGSSAERVLIVGSGRAALDVLAAFRARRDLAVQLMGFVSRPAAAELGFKGQEYRQLLGSKSIEEYVQEYGVTRVVIASDLADLTVPAQDLVRLRVQGIQMEEANTAIAALAGRVSLESVRPEWFIFSDGFRRSRLEQTIKRTFDMACSLAGLAISAPVMAAVAMAVRLESNGPAVYRQARVGLGGKIFTIYKFRSMRLDAEAVSGAQWSQENDPRITRVGRFIRKYRFDELPQFVNVLRGDMSFVGPRPERPEFVELLGEKLPYYHERHSVRPGLTGWAQVRYAYGASVEDAAKKLEYDLFYLKNMSVAFDAAVLFHTVRTILFGHGR